MLIRILPVLLFMVAGQNVQAADPAVEKALASFTEGAIQGHMEFLAHDLLEGRETGTRGYDLAAEYVAAQFRTLGLEPAGDEGSYLQWINFRRAVQVEEGCDLALVGKKKTKKLKYAEHYLMRGNSVHLRSRGEAPLVFVGYGVSAPERGYDDYAGVDVKGKIVVLLRGAPPTFDHNERAFYARGSLKSREAVKRGAVGMFTFLTPEDAEGRPWEKSVINSKISRMRWMRPDGTVHGVEPQLEVGAFLSPDGVKTIFQDASQDLDTVFERAMAGEPNSFDLAWRAKYGQESRHATVRSPNVAGMLRGSDPSLAREVVVYTGHLDHLGMGEAIDGDRIYNGAFDNASGIATMIEVARAFRSMPRSPRRSLLFLAVTGEEKGLLGSEYFTEYPTVPLESIVGNINLDMFLMLHDLNDIIAFGAEHSSLGPVVERAAGSIGIRMTPDPMPAEVIFVRSDQFNFVKKGIPAVFLVAGWDSGDPAVDGPALHGAWLRDTYHSRSDDMTQEIHYPAGVAFARANLLIGLEVANSNSRPGWNPGDFFGDRFGSGGQSPE